MDPGSFEPITGLEYVKPFSQPAGSYSDDGSMTLALAQSIIDSQGKYNHALSIQYFVDWFSAGRFSTINHAWDVGRSTRSALQSWRKRGTEDLQRTQDVVNRKLDVEQSSGNGSLMRIAPIGLALWRDQGEATRVAREQSRVTHPALACLEACEVQTLLICGVLRGESKEQLCDRIKGYKFTHDALTQRLSRYKTISDWQAKSAPDMHSSGWVVDTLEVALWGFFKFDSWAAGALAVANLGGDADTAAAVYGNKEFIAEVAGKLAEFVSSGVSN
ncbi:ADP-ribosylglycohydrolase [Aspergillus nomiae NRRL 13137]|uniref:ADP-ribosylhydrolase ARH3 n=1 Tax=Aspergillus nomiae NRRL (strain ATCC 15546 / NRRL 13137 / CBS 260.88 / M93) TaxID=1509407 RepID=A0A0L1IUU9_ASPN3|nr:ADP-ribosylglycohydrolase [Aspergillus nomiae NRRL 13137]KNG83277.1 ADP-ribosylglycohydrolase [Aspergillus nomiae NRRL 13137]